MLFENGVHFKDNSRKNICFITFSTVIPDLKLDICKKKEEDVG